VLAWDWYNKLTVFIMTRIVFGIFSLPYPETFKFDKIQISTCSVYTIKFHQEKSFHIFFIYIHIFCQFELFLIFIKIKTSNSNEILAFKLQSPSKKFILQFAQKRDHFNLHIITIYTRPCSKAISRFSLCHFIHL
jgi:hypothetical protein